ncbi:hypothetical protein T4B_13503 [Trichinella pseudospiralis]|uniref:Uncharacterized protein n=1 Tax=Trichinella pseudospiralis TaxID=6337 RepID=A0A0V1H7F6_TRIPS|nr:hypothetical protein T4B_13503 [Trichinella pseudospiralis]KRZ38948.1 hypothetical protein T4C_5977 [Trichinella pseudospiralis]
MDGRLQGVFPPSYFNSHSSYDLIRPSCYCITGVPCLLGGSSAAAAWGIAVLEFKITPLGRTSDTLSINLPRPLSAGASSNGGSVSTRLSPLPDGHHWIVVDDLQDFRGSPTCDIQSHPAGLSCCAGFIDSLSRDCLQEPVVTMSPSPSIPEPARTQGVSSGNVR